VVKGLALIESLTRHEKNEFTIYVVCLDEITRIILEKLRLPNVQAIPFHDIEQRDFALLKAKQNRSLKEYYWTTTPTIILRILERNPQIDVLTYMDADLYYYSSPDPIFEEFGHHSILIHEHRFAPAQRFLERFGKYNVGLLCFRNDPDGLQALTWWRDRCNKWCYARLEDGKYADQLYLDDWSTRFKNVVVLQNAGAGVGPWNHIQYRFSMDPAGKKVMVDNVPLVFYHFHSLTFVEPRIIIPSKYVSNPLSKDILRLCFLPYIHALAQAISKARSILPDLAFGLLNKNELNYRHTFLAKRNIENDLKKAALPHSKISLDEHWDCYCSEQLLEYSNTIKQVHELIHQNNITAASTCLALALKEFPDSPDLLLARIQLEIPDTRKSNALEELLQLHPNFALAHNELGNLLLQVDERDKALDHLQKAVHIRPDNLVFQKNLADLYYVGFERIQDALEIYLKLLEASPKDVEILLIIGNICTSLKKFDEANVFYTCVLEVDPKNELARRNLLLIDQISQKATRKVPAEQMNSDIRPLMEGADYEKVIEALNTLLESYPDYALAHGDLGVLYFNAGNTDKARHHYQKAVQLDPQNIAFKKNLAAFYHLGVGQLEEALHIYLKVLEIQPEDVEVLTILGNICAALHKVDDAGFFYKRVLQIDPQNDIAGQQLEAL
jgi:tetratricopeptide (TPR) repeat protein